MSNLLYFARSRRVVSRVKVILMEVAVSFILPKTIQQVLHHPRGIIRDLKKPRVDGRVEELA